MSPERTRRDAFERLFAANYWSVRDYVARRAPSSVVEDVVAETFLTAWRRSDELRPDALPWLLGVARRVLANHLRAERRRSALANRLRLVSVDAPWEPPTEMSAELGAALFQLSSGEREALLLCAWEGLDPRRAAVVAGCSQAAFRARLHRARRSVTRHLAQSGMEQARGHVSQEITS